MSAGMDPGQLMDEALDLSPGAPLVSFRCALMAPIEPHLEVRYITDLDIASGNLVYIRRDATCLFI